MSETMAVPPAVPSLENSSMPVVLVVALKYSLPLKTVKFAGLELAVVVARFATSTVPALVPSDFQSSVPVVPSLALKNT